MTILSVGRIYQSMTISCIPGTRTSTDQHQFMEQTIAINFWLMLCMRSEHNVCQNSSNASLVSKQTYFYLSLSKAMDRTIGKIKKNFSKIKIFECDEKKNSIFCCNLSQ